MESRLQKHNCSRKGFTGKTPDCIIKYTEAYAQKKARKREANAGALGKANAKRIMK